LRTPARKTIPPIPGCASQHPSISLVSSCRRARVWMRRRQSFFREPAAVRPASRTRSARDRI
jgi:hypothetical protein